MKIANIILTSQNGGAEQVFLDYCFILKKLGHEILAITRYDAPYSHILEKENIIVKKIKNNFGFYDFFAIKNIKKTLEEFQADAIIMHSGRSCFLGLKAARKIKNKKIFTIGVNHSTNIKRAIGCDLLISVNKKIFYKTIDLGQNSEKSFVVSNAIDTKNITPNFKKINFQKDVITLGIMARFDKTKGFLEMIKALKILEKSHKKFNLKIAGDGYLKEEMLNLIKNLELNNIEFLGWIQDKKSFFNSIDIFILPSLEETFGLVLLEAMKYSTPIICSDADGPKEILRDKIDALFFEINPKEKIEERISDAILKMIQDEELAKKMAQNSFIRLQEKFSFESLEKCLREIFGKMN